MHVKANVRPIQPVCIHSKAPVWHQPYSVPVEGCEQKYFIYHLMAFQVGGSGELIQRQGSQRHRRSGSSDTGASVTASGLTPPPPQGAPHHSSASPLPAAYIALYPYKPHKADELELKKGAIYMVTERCQDGWFKGTSSRAQKCGVFPGNYVAPIRWVMTLFS